MPNAVYGTANLFGLVAEQASRTLLQTAFDQGFRYFDTAPSYGHGQSEMELGRLIGHWPETVQVTTKVGIAAVPVPSPAVRLAKSAARRLPAGLQRRLRGDAPPPGRGEGRFSSAEVTASVDQSLRRVKRIDRLLLHEVTPGDITDELLTVLDGYLSRGDVGRVGVATGNTQTLQCLARAPEILTVAHIAIGPLAVPVTLPAGLVGRVGHGALGAAGSDLKVVRQRLLENTRHPTDAEAALQTRWREATAGTRWSGPSGLADLLFARAASLDLTEVIVATSRLDTLGSLRGLVSGSVTVEPEVRSILERVTSS